MNHKLKRSRFFLCLKLFGARSSSIFSKAAEASYVAGSGEINVCEIYGNWGALEMITTSQFLA